MNLHKETKHEGLNFPCPHCKHISSQKGDLKRHIQSKHSEPKDKQIRKKDKQAEREDQVPESKPNCSVIKTKKLKKEMPGKPRERRLTHKYKQLMRSVVADFKTK